MSTGRAIFRETTVLTPFIEAEERRLKRDTLAWHRVHRLRWSQTKAARAAGLKSARQLRNRFAILKAMWAERKAVSST
jgi:hypothetical protein